MTLRQRRAILRRWAEEAREVVRLYGCRRRRRSRRVRDVRALPPRQLRRRWNTTERSCLRALPTNGAPPATGIVGQDSWLTPASASVCRPDDRPCHHRQPKCHRHLVRMTSQLTRRALAIRHLFRAIRHLFRAIRHLIRAIRHCWPGADPIGVVDVLQPDLAARHQALGLVPDLDHPKLLQPAPVDG
jgi:hypothetical protein